VSSASAEQIVLRAPWRAGPAQAGALNGRAGGRTTGGNILGQLASPVTQALSADAEGIDEDAVPGVEIEFRS
jgi:hypothetical protein